MSDASADPTSLSLGELRALRAQLQQEEDVVSFVRRIAQGRLDIVREERVRRESGLHATAEPGALAAVFGQQQGAGSVRPPRDTDVSADHPRVVELTEICDRLHFADFADLDAGELTALESALSGFESAQSADRRELFARIDVLSRELVDRYKSGGATVDSLLD
ncbi:MAG: hypothetical protein EBU67_02345 [Actinobacteria bacterium]|nr:hypothetical protein [Actinomycetota bacterium]NBP53129.1 hypothetical protein [Actinomycetota bacterium]